MATDTDNQNRAPVITIGVPVYNEATFLPSALDNLLEQDFKDFEIIVSDNGSTDSTPDIVNKYKKKQGNISYIRYEKNRGAIYNWNNVISQAKGEYFCYAAGHDLLSPNFLSETLKLLKNNPNGILAYAPTYWMSYSGEIRTKYQSFADTTGTNLMQRLNLVFWGNQDSMHGLIRMSAIKRTNLQRYIFGSGAVWLSELSLLGDFLVATDARRFRRESRGATEETRDERLSRYSKILFLRRRLRVLPHWRIPFAYLQIAFLGKFSMFKRIRIAGFFVPASIRQFGMLMLLDIVSLIKRVLFIK